MVLEAWNRLAEFDECVAIATDAQQRARTKKRRFDAGVTV